MKPVTKESWWLDTSSFPCLLWARIRVFEDGTAEVFDLDGRYTRFENESDARSFLAEDEYDCFSGLDDDERAEVGLPGDLEPPTAASDAELVPKMVVRTRMR